MSFLNPVNEPVLRFSSTDADAPQINYAARTAGDVKTVLKACLVTGYGAVASAGWSIVNEVNHVCEFVSPSAAMSDYRLGINDTSTSSTTWYYRYQNARTDPATNKPTKNFTNVNKTSARNGWQLLATEQGILFIEILDDTIALGLVTRVTYFGRIKSALKNEAGNNIGWWSLGHNGFDPTAFFNTSTYIGSSSYSDNTHHFRVGAYVSPTIVIMNTRRVNAYYASDVLSAVEVVSKWYLYDSVRDNINGGAGFAGEHPAVLIADCNDNAERFKVQDKLFDARPVLSVPVSYATGDIERYHLYTLTLLINLDYWEY